MFKNQKKKKNTTIKQRGMLSKDKKIWTNPQTTARSQR